MTEDELDKEDEKFRKYIAKVCKKMTPRQALDYLVYALKQIGTEMDLIRPQLPYDDEED